MGLNSRLRPKLLNVIDNLKGRLQANFSYFWQLFFNLKMVRGGIKKTVFFTFSQKIQTHPPPPPFLTTSVFSDKDFLDLPRPPPFSQNQSKKSEYFLIRIFWIGRDPPPQSKKCHFFYKKPPFLVNYAKKPFWIG